MLDFVECFRDLWVSEISGFFGIVGCCYLPASGKGKGGDCILRALFWLVGGTRVVRRFV